MNCSFCGRKAVFFRKYEGSYLCKDHFCETIEAKAKRTISKHGMVKKGDKIAVALSGGKDSSTALYLMKKIFGKWRGLEIIAISIDEGIEGYRAETIEHAKKLCKKLGIKHYIFSFKKELGRTLDSQMEIVKKKKLKIKEPCTYCGIGRRYVLNKKARELKVTKLCLGHNLDDEIQGILLNFLRGDLLRASRMSGLLEPNTPIGKKLFIPRMKPLREIPEREVALYAMLKGLYAKRKECPYAGGVRFDAMDFFNSLETKYPGIKFSFLLSFDKIKPWMEAGLKAEDRGLKTEDIQKCRNCGEPGSKGLCRVCELWGKKK